ncbi:hypothetical protein K457DRAFT_168679 [Linnemannia elongata AG-77]|uniref:Uncharacterized protein n=1 Tax=Linnemannia elongata AG-77 TaxID=1314771 RepID=A0A197KIS6_9FUNG|nr:hypothetical protein K457DRAFT_168679 [Linnemannia elongata AG-77]
MHKTSKKKKSAIETDRASLSSSFSFSLIYLFCLFLCPPSSLLFLHSPFFFLLSSFFLSSLFSLLSFRSSLSSSLPSCSSSFLLVLFSSTSLGLSLLIIPYFTSIPLILSPHSPSSLSHTHTLAPPSPSLEPIRTSFPFHFLFSHGHDTCPLF